MVNTEKGHFWRLNKLEVLSFCVMQEYNFTPEDARLSTEEKLLLLETGTCPTAGFLGCVDALLI